MLLALAGRLQHDHYLIRTRDAMDEYEYEALMSVHATLHAEAAQMAELASKTAARLEHIKQLLITGGNDEFKRVHRLELYAEITKTLTKIHHGMMTVYSTCRNCGIPHSRPHY